MTDQTNTPTVADLTTAMARSAMIVTLHTSCLGEQRVDRRLSKQLADYTGGTNGAFNGTKKIFAGAQNWIKAAQDHQRQTRSELNRITVPFGMGGLSDKGPRLLANTNYVRMTEIVGKAQTKLAEIVNDFEANYDRCIAAAQRHLGDAFDPAMYPHKTDLHRHFRIDVDVSPVPTRGGFMGLGEDLGEALDSYMEQRHSERADRALEHVTERVQEIAERIRKVSEKVVQELRADPTEKVRKTNLYDSLFDEARSVADLIECYSPVVGTTSGLASAADFLRRVANMGKEGLRNDADLTEKVAKQAKTVVDCFDV